MNSLLPFFPRNFLFLLNSQVDIIKWRWKSLNFFSFFSFQFLKGFFLKNIFSQQMAAVIRLIILWLKWTFRLCINMTKLCDIIEVMWEKESRNFLDLTYRMTTLKLIWKLLFPSCQFQLKNRWRKNTLQTSMSLQWFLLVSKIKI